ncbi:MAG TPA: pilus assembly protein [Lachnospiraceae bacterium]|nr:pilus assembly protein [Lachnospiraceae bacterium]
MATDYEDYKRRIKQEVLDRIDMMDQQDDAAIKELINDSLEKSENFHVIPLSKRIQLSKEIFYSIRRLDILEELTEDPKVTEIMINGKDNIFIERDGRIYKWNKAFESDSKLEDVIQQIVAKCNRTVNESSPIVDARLANGSRVNIVLPPISLSGPIVTIRKFPDKPIDMDKLISFGAISKEVVLFLEKLVKAKYNIIISGGTGSGKTTFLNALSNYIPKDERLITIEDSAELQIQGVANLVRLETRNANVEGCKEITIRDLIKSSLRMRPDRIIVGEVRGSEAIDMVQALNTGHDGSLSTGHANSAKDMLARLETMILMGMDLPLSAIRGQLASGIDIIVHLGRLRDKSRKVLCIEEVLELKDNNIETNVLYQFEEEGENDEGKIIGTLQKKEELVHKEKLKAAGIA